MPATTFTTSEKQEILKLFGIPIDDLELKVFKKKLKELRLKFHPDNFEQFANEAVKEMATEKFQAIEILSEKIEAYLKGVPAKRKLSKSNDSEADFKHPDAVFAGKHMKIEILTSDTDLKYHLFGTQYRWLEFGDSFRIPNTNASIVIDEGHLGRKIGFQESIRMFLTFKEDDSIETIVEWLYEKIDGRSTTLIIVGETVPVEFDAMVLAVKKETYLRIGSVA